MGAGRGGGSAQQLTLVRSELSGRLQRRVRAVHPALMVEQPSQLVPRRMTLLVELDGIAQRRLSVVGLVLLGEEGAEVLVCGCGGLRVSRVLDGAGEAVGRRHWQSE